jgi:hypothetical protein
MMEAVETHPPRLSLAPHFVNKGIIGQCDQKCLGKALKNVTTTQYRASHRIFQKIFEHIL